MKGGGHGEHLFWSRRESTDRTWMTCSVPARILPPLSGPVVRRISGEGSSVSVTFTVESSSGDTNRAFPFPRNVPEASDGSPGEVRRHDVLVEAGGSNHGFEAEPWTRHARGSSSGFLAGVIAQEWPCVRLHNRQHQTAARVYRDVDSLGLLAARPVRHSTRI